MSKPVQVEVVLSHSERLPVVDVWLVVDILRATTVMVRWFELGGRALYPADSAKNAFLLADRLRQEGETPLLMGEQNAIPPRGFDLGNSPLDLKESLTAERSCAVMATTNGTQAFLKAASTGTPALAACARNATAVLDLALSKGRRLGIFCSGRKGRPAWDDTLCAGLLIDALTRVFPEIDLADSARLALLARRGADGQGARGFEASLRSADHAVFLEKIGFSADIAFAAETDAASSVPELFEQPDGDGLRAVLREGAGDGFASEWGPALKAALGASPPLSAGGRGGRETENVAGDVWKPFAPSAPDPARHLFLAGKGFKKQYVRTKKS